MPERYYTVKEAAEVYFQGKVSAREVYLLFSLGKLRGFRVGAKILIYESSLDAYRRERENSVALPQSAIATLPLPTPSHQEKAEPAIRLSRLPE
jgi:excisionase family DNA binding protein